MTKMPTPSLGEACGGVTAKPPRPMPPQAPPPSVTKHENPRVAFIPIPNSHQDMEDFFHKCAMSFDGVKEKESLLHLLKAWMQQNWRRDNEAKRLRQDRRAVRPRQRPSLPPEARGTPRGSGGRKYNRAEHSSLAVCGNQVDSLPQNGQFARGAEAAAARWEKRYNMQVSITEEALLAKRSAEISLREAKRVLHAVRAEAATVAREAASAKEEAAKALEVREGGRDKQFFQDGLKQTLEAREMFTKIETDLRRRLQDTQDRLAQAEEEGMKLRQALDSSRRNRPLQPVVACLGQVLTECLASLGLVRGVPDEEFHMCLSALRDRAEEAGRGFLSVEGLHAAAEGARALDASRFLTRQLEEAQLDANRQRIRRINAEARLMEKEEGDRARGASVTSAKEDILRARKAAEETITRMEVAEVEIRRLRDELREKDGIRATPVRRKSAAMLMTVDIPRIFQEGHRYIQQKMRVKALEAQKEIAQIHEESEARLREARNISVKPRQGSKGRNRNHVTVKHDSC